MTPTPGLAFLLAAASRIVLPPLILHAVLRNVAISGLCSWRLISISSAWLVTLFVYSYARATLVRYIHTREARRLGAELVPQVPGRLPGNVDLIWKNFFGRDLYLGDGFADSIDKYGTTIGNTVLGDSRVITIHPQNVKQILATDFDNFEKGAKFNRITGSVLGSGVFNSDGPRWQFHRKLTRPFFARERVTDFGIFDAKASIAIERMRERFSRGDAIDFQDICSRFTIDSACEFLLGASIHSLDAPLPLPQPDGTTDTSASNRFARAFADAQISISTRARIGVAWPLFEVWRDRTADDMREVRGFIEPIVRAAMGARGGAKGEGGESLLQHLLSVTDDMKVIVDETINIMLAGRDTTAGLLTFVVYCLALHPDVLARVREEIISTVGTCRAPNFDDVRGMKYLRAVLNETLRLFPSVPFNSRQTIKPAVFTNDEGKRLYIPANTRVTFAAMLTQRHVPYWGPDAHLFDPDRWLDDRVRKYVTPNPFIYLPFSAGPRICLGQQFAYHETSFFIIRLLQQFDRIALAPECQAPGSRPPASWKGEAGTGTPRKSLEECVLASHLTMYTQGGLWVRMGAGKVTEGV